MRHHTGKSVGCRGAGSSATVQGCKAEALGKSIIFVEVNGKYYLAENRLKEM
ncbi:MAG: hypothetical protein ABSF44_11370 [Candidatus Bathyarchaeia archaeon]